MSRTIEIVAPDGHRFTALEARPGKDSIGGLIVLHEIYGMTGYIRRVAERYAAEGYHVIAPALFDRVGKAIEFTYDQAGSDQGRKARDAVGHERALTDIEAVRDALGTRGVGIIGYSWGGLLAWLAACRIRGIAAVVSYYGGRIHLFAGETPQCPVVCHFGDRDHAIPIDQVEAIRRAQPTGVDVHLYPAGHGFDCDERTDYHAESAKLAEARTLTLLRTCIGSSPAISAP